MQRWLVRGNVALFVCLFVLVVVNAHALFTRRVAASGSSDAIAKDGVRFFELGAGRHECGVIEFGTPMVAADRTRDPVAPGLVVLEPAAKIALRWRTPTALAIDALEPLRRATTYRIHFAPTLRALDGRGLPAELQLAWPTRPVAVTATSCDEDEQGALARVHFDLPVTLESFLAHATLSDAAGKAIPFTAALEDKGQDAASAFLLRFPAGHDLARLTLAAGLRARSGDRPLGAAHRAEFRLRAPLAVAGFTATQSRLEIRFNHALPAAGRELVRTEPAQPFQTEHEDATLRLVGAFAPGTAIAVHLPAGFPGLGRHRLPEAVRVSLRVPDLHAALGFANPGSVISRFARLEMPVRGVNLDGFRLSTRTVYPNNLVRLLQGAAHSWRGADAEVFTPAQSTEIRVRAARNETFTETVGLEAVLPARADGKPPLGLHELSLQGLDGALHERRLVQVTDLGISVRALPDAIAVRVRSLATGKAIGGAFVRVLTPTNQDLCTATTQEDGIAQMRFASPAADRRPFAVLASLGEDLACVDLEGFAVEHVGDELDGRPFLATNPREMEGLVLLDRSALRPGERLGATVLVRDALGKADAGRRYELALHGPGRNAVRARQVSDDGTGLFHDAHTLPADAPMGSWRLDLVEVEGRRVLASAPFRVEAFVPDRLEASVRGDGEWKLGRRATLAAEGKWLEGTAAAGLTLEGNVRLERDTSRVPGHEGFSFEALDPAVPPGALPRVQAALDERGKALLHVDLPTPRAPQRLVARASFTLLDPSGRGVPAETLVPVTRAQGIVGIRALPGGAEAVLVGAAPEARGPLTLRLERRHWVSRTVPRGGGRFGYECKIASDLVEEQVLPGPGVVQWKTPRAAGEWYVVSARFGAAGAEQVAEASLGDAPLRPDTLRLAAPTAALRPGARAELALDAPFAGTGFVTLETTTLHAAYTVELAAGRNTLGLEVPSELTTPNLHVVVTLTSGQARKDAAGPAWILGAASLPVQHAERATRVALEVEDKVAPESEVVVRVCAPGATRATLALVDEGILRLTGHPVPDPAAHFAARRRLLGQGADGGRQLLQNVTFDPGVLVGGDDDGDPLGSRLQGSTFDTVRTVALATGVVRLDTNGCAEARFRLPPYEGRLRVVAIAAGASVVGAATRPLVVAGPLGVRIAVPRRVSPGDEVAALVTVRNTTGSPRAFELALESSGSAALAAGENPVRRLEVADGKVVTFPVRLVAKAEAGRAGLVARAAGGEHAARAEEAFAVAPLLPFREEFAGFVCANELVVETPPAFEPGTVRASVLVDGDPSTRLLPLFESLVQYPYGCAEQTTSRCLALLACRALFDRAQADLRDREPGMLLENGVFRLLSMQTRSGGLAAWPGASDPSAFCSVYGLELLSQAKSEGVFVPEEALAALAKYVERLLVRAPSGGLRCFAAATLAGRGFAVRGWLARLAEEATTREELVLVALGHSRLGERERALALLAQPDPQTAGPRTKNVTEATFVRRSDADDDEDGALPGLQTPALPYAGAERLAAWELRTLLAAAPADPRISTLAEELTRRALRATDLTTQGQAQVLLALAAFDKVRGSQAVPSTVQVRVGTRTTQLRAGQRASFDLAPGEKLAFTSRGTCHGFVAFAGRTRAASADAAGPAEATLLVRQGAGPASRPVALRQGQTAELVVTGTLASSVENLLITCPLAGGLEPERGTPTLWLFDAKGERSRASGRSEVRDDRVLFFATTPVAGRYELTVPVRAVSVGRFDQGVVQTEDLYAPGSTRTSRTQGSLVVQAAVR